MNKFVNFLLKGGHKFFERMNGSTVDFVPKQFDPDAASDAIFDGLSGEKPFMVARLGSVELNIMINIKGIKHYKNCYLGYVLGKNPQFWWNERSMQEMQTNAGFFPIDEANLMRFYDLMIDDVQQVDILGSWLNQEIHFEKQLQNAKKYKLLALEPYWSENPWSRILEGKKVLVVHPFYKSILKQYEKREQLFKNHYTLPTFESLKVIPAVQSIGGENNGFDSWFDALSWMKDEMDKSDYDIALIGCGAYGLPLAAHAKRQGKKAVHLGGALQLLFGIKGNRWLDENYGEMEFQRKGTYKELFNDAWVFPSDDERPSTAKNVENACYW